MINDVSNKNFKILVSVIIPAYNVEKYIEKCITSILEQTYKNIEIIIVNDGSTDKTGQIIESISKKDDRIRFINKKNQGVSAARNSGLEISTGDYLIFVDGDDYIAQDYVEYMLSIVEKTGSEFCLSKCYYTKKDEKQIEKDTVEKLKPEEATAFILSPDVVVYSPNKIIKRSLIFDNNIRFSTDLFYGEGLTFVTTLAQIANSIGVGNRKVYYYRRNNIASATTKFDINKIYNGEIALKNIEKEFIIDSPKIQTMYKLHICVFYLGALVKIKANGLEKEYLKDYKRWKSYIRSNVWKLIFNRDVSIYRKALLLGGCISPWIMMKLDTTRRRYISANSVSD